MKGYLNSIIVLVLSSLLLTLYLSYFSYIHRDANQLSSLTPALYPAYHFSDFAGDLQGMLVGTNVSRNGTVVTISLADAIPRSDVNSTLDSYGDYIEDNYSARIGADISLNLTPLMDGSYEVVFSDGNYYAHDYNATNQTMQFANGTATGLQAITISITATGTRQNITPWTWVSGGDTAVTIYYSDSDGAYSDSGNISSTTDKTYSFLVTGGRIDVRYGSFAGDGALRITESNTSATVLLNLTKDAPLPLEHHFNATADYTQARVARAGNITISTS
jgi:hypothetical protein